MVKNALLLGASALVSYGVTRMVMGSEDKPS